MVVRGQLHQLYIIKLMMETYTYCGLVFAAKYLTRQVRVFRPAVVLVRLKDGTD